MKFDTRIRTHIIAELTLARDNASFRHTVLSHAVTFLEPLIGKVLSKREGTKLFGLFSDLYPSARFTHKKGSMCNSFEYSFGEYKSGTSQNIDISEWGNPAFTQTRYNSLVESLGYSAKHVERYSAQLANIHELIALEESQGTEIAELQARHVKERQTFAAQTKCIETDIDWLIKEAKTKVRDEDQQTYWDNKRKEIQENNQE